MNTELYRRPYTSVEESIKAANAVWKEYVTYTKSNAEFRAESPEKKLRICQQMFKQFHYNYPIMFRYMIVYQCYYVKAFRLYLNKLVSVPVKSENEKMERDAEYVKYLYREKSGKNYDAKYAAQLKTDIYTALKKEKDKFKKDWKKKESDVDKQVELNQQEKRKHLLEYFRRKSEE